MAKQKHLLDTCTFFWALFQTKKLSNQAKEIILDPKTTIYVSSISFWELAIKKNWTKHFAELTNKELRKLRKKHGYLSLPLIESDTNILENLNPKHKDPFDRMLVAQAINQNLTILTPDKQIHEYPVKTIW